MNESSFKAIWVIIVLNLKSINDVLFSFKSDNNYY